MVCFSGNDQVIVSGDAKVRDACVETLRRLWPVQDENAKYAYPQLEGAHWLKLTGNINGHFSDASGAVSQAVLTHLVASIDDAGYEVVANADLFSQYYTTHSNNSHQEHRLNSDTWFLRPRQQQPTSNVSASALESMTQWPTFDDARGETPQPVPSAPSLALDVD